MSSIIFLYNNKETHIQCSNKEKMDTIIQRFCKEATIKKENVNFLYNGKILNEDCTEDKILLNLENKKLIIVNDIAKNELQDIFIQSKRIICPECHESASISIEDYLISIFNCKNGHKIDNMPIDEFEFSQKINISKIICDICLKNNMGNTENNKFFKCINCHKNLCPNCKIFHPSGHNIINYEDNFYICDEHGKKFIAYCFDCKMNICLECKDSHQAHTKKFFTELIEKNKEKSYKELENFQNMFSLMVAKINEIINICSIVKTNYEILLKINKRIQENINKPFINFQNIINLEFINNKYEKDLNSIINENNIKSVFSNILRIKEMMNNYEELQNSLLIKYKIKETDKKIKIFGGDFIENNNEKCKIINNKKEFELSEYFEFKENKELNKNILEIKLIGIKNISNASAMFSGCSSLISLGDISKWNTSKITRMDGMFYGCSSLMSLPDISILDISNVTRLDFMFYGCSSLKFLPDISKWNTSKVNLIYSMFYGCSSLTSLPDISKWDTSKITDMNFTFYGCSSLISLPEISEWNTSRVTDMNSLFSGCSLLSSLPDISKWNTSYVTFMNSMFYKCSSLISLPDISVWNTIKVTDMNSMFYDCSSLISLPDISIWYTSRVIYMYSMFYGCSSLKYLPDISQWNTSKVTDMNSMFYGCSSLKELPDISIWYTSKLTFIYLMFYGCSSLISLPDISQWNTSKITLMYSMFCGCSSLISIPDFSKWDISNVTDMKSMFSGCSKDLNIPKKFQ